LIIYSAKPVTSLVSSPLTLLTADDRAIPLCTKEPVQESPPMPVD
jgi:hypothetical protein